MWGVLYVIASLAQMLPIVETIPNHIDVSTGLQLLIAFIIAEIPIIGSVAGIYGSVVSWDLTVAVGLALFIWPIVILLVYLFRYQRSDSDSATEQNDPSVKPQSTDAAISPWMANVLREQVEQEDAAIAPPPTDSDAGAPRQPDDPESRIESPPPPPRNSASGYVADSVSADSKTINAPESVDAGSDLETTSSAPTAPEVETPDAIANQDVTAPAGLSAEPTGAPDVLAAQNASATPDTSVGPEASLETAAAAEPEATPEPIFEAGPNATSAPIPAPEPETSSESSATSVPETPSESTPAVGQDTSEPPSVTAPPALGDRSDEQTDPSEAPSAARDSDSAPDRGPETSSGPESSLDRLRDQIVACRGQIVELSGAADNPALLRSINREVPELFASIALVSDSEALESDFVERLLRPVSDNDEYTDEELSNRLHERVQVYGPELLDPDGNAGYLFARRIGRVGDGVLIRMVNDSVSDSRASFAAE